MLGVRRSEFGAWCSVLGAWFLELGDRCSLFFVFCARWSVSGARCLVCSVLSALGAWRSMFGA
eukprot:5919658-Alexandrium_andersonii.AAC.1